ncbi:hypothetical protein SLS56_003890 [Neofusicoccum ribis]|uniref:NACHT domain-containing protein n=1 Tax=Neofusicoccum ribis TaxID=45134 RepID=A0ABR3SYJ0_9PEZI
MESSQIWVVSASLIIGGLGLIFLLRGLSKSSPRKPAFRQDLDYRSTFRLQGLPKSYAGRELTRKDVERLVGSAFKVEQGITVLVKSLGDHPLNENQKVATLSFSEIPGLIRQSSVRDREFRAGPTLDDGTPAGPWLYMDIHFNGLTPLHHQSDSECEVEWILKNKSYMEWCNLPCGLLWIQGKPGSGKSTVMKYALKEMEATTKEVMETSRHDDIIVTSFFFHGRGTDLQRTPVGLFRSLLNQILKHFPEALAEITAIYEEKCRRKGPPRTLLIYIDALDECGTQDAQKLRAFFSKLASENSKLSSKLMLKVCFSSRWYPVLHWEPSGSRHVIAVEDHNTRDISVVVHSRLADMSSEKKRDFIKPEIVSRARGVFQWAELVCNEALELGLIGEPTPYIIRKIREVPEDLNDLYRSLLEEVDPQKLVYTVRLFRWVCFAGRPLTVLEIQHASMLAPDMEETSIEKYKKKDEFQGDLEDTIRAIKNLSKGLIEIKTAPEEDLEDQVPKVQLIHQSVLDYLLDTGFQHLEGRLSSTPAGRGHFHIAVSCMRYIFMQEMQMFLRRTFSWDQKINQARFLVADSNEKILQDFPLVRYAFAAVIFHLQMTEAEDFDQAPLLELLSLPCDEELGGCYNDILASEKGPVKLWDWSKRLIHILAEAGVVTALRPLVDYRDTNSHQNPSLDRVSRLVSVSRRHRKHDETIHISGQVNMDLRTAALLTPLHYAAMNNHGVAVRELLRSETVNPNAQDAYQLSPLHYAAKNGSANAVVELLASDTVDRNARDRLERTPLHHSVLQGHLPIVQLLLEDERTDSKCKDAFNATPLYLAVTANSPHKNRIAECLLQWLDFDVNTQELEGNTVLHAAIIAGKDALVRQLLSVEDTDVNIKDHRGHTPLMTAIVCNSRSAANDMVKMRNADLNLGDKMGITPLMMAAEMGLPSFVRLFLSSRNIDPTSRTTEGAQYWTLPWRSSKK